MAEGPCHRLEWLVEADGSIRVIPVAASPVQAFRGMSNQGVGNDEGEQAGRLAYEQLQALPNDWLNATEPLLHKDPGFQAIAGLDQEWLG